jgi:hypothetical protein
MITIDKNVPLPTGMTQVRTKRPFGDMEVGDSFLEEWHPPEKEMTPEELKAYRRRQVNALRNSAYMFGTRLNPVRKYTHRVEEQGVRVWRIE